MKESKLYLLRHKRNGKFLHRKFKSSHQRHMAPYNPKYKDIDKVDLFFSAESAIEAAMFPTIAGIKTSFRTWGKWARVPTNANQYQYKKVPGTEWFDEMDVYILHPCINGKVDLEKMESV